jgi:hypothetical protein
MPACVNQSNPGSQDRILKFKNYDLETLFTVFRICDTIW